MLTWGFPASLNSTASGVTQTAVSGDFKTANSNGALARAPQAAAGVLLVISGFFALL
jgi:hypothetical protein